MTKRNTPSAKPTSLRVNRAPVMTLWSAVVAERMGYDPQEALSLGQAASVLNARSKGRRLGIHDADEPDQERPKRAEDERVAVCGRPVPVVKTKDGVRAVVGDDVIAPEKVRRYLERSFGDHLAQARAAMAGVARSYRPEELEQAAYGLYERFRPAVPAGVKGWGAKGELDLARLQRLARAPAAEHHRPTAKRKAV